MENVIYKPGDLVTVNKDLQFKPVMVVKGSDRNTLIGKENTNFRGIKCWWFNSTYNYCEATFNTKDLQYYEE